ncbi:class I SAM-dependent methyltransferase [Desulfonema ishimotonii]|uniref:Class I SAM-dependent methyltransferase n=1 Tax=Desulfonema ishimotonii TaxID=45657 RepID=A0A401G1E7_9BACT|nr:methyltransferase domain-containing protein [Desulfonema ishimotonii]GBC63042.1 class I SAM-dependent methyltransferase [Desulfonema ishimotonii]
MIDHFGLSATFYDRFIGRPDFGKLCRMLRLPAKGRMLDAGGGTGRVAAHLRKLVDHLVVLDASGKMLAQARHRDLAAVAAHAEHLPFPDAHFDRILVTDALHHFRDQQAAIREFARVLSPGGLLAVEEPDIRRFPVKLVAVAETLLMMRSHFHSPVQIREMMARSGLSARTDGGPVFRAWITGEKPV